MKKIKENLEFVWKYAKEYKFEFNILLMINIINILIDIIIPIISAKIIIDLTTNEYEQVILISLILLLVEIVSNILSKITKNIAIRIYKYTNQNLSLDIVNNILKTRNEYIDNNGSGVFIQRLTTDVSNISNIFDGFLEILSNFIWHIGVLFAILVINPIIFVYIILCMLITTIIENHRTNIYNKEDSKYRKYLDNISGFISELMRASKDIKMLNTEKTFESEYSKKIKQLNNQKSNMQNKNTSYILFNNIISNIYSFALIIIIIILLEHKYLSITFAIVIYNYYSYVKNFPYLFGKILNNLKDFSLSTERIREIIDSNTFKKETFGNKKIIKIDGNFEFKNVAFSYDKNLVLKDVNFKINGGETVAFVGKSGSGKSTIFNLICKMYETNNGEITIDGININELDKDSIRGNITIISQNPYIFNMSIKDNLKLVKKNMTDEEMIKACKTACLDEFIKDLPKGYDTIIGENGVMLSGGQKQRLAIARALIQNTKIILFDEATSALDNETQEKIQKAIENMKNKYTILIIAHRLSTIKNASRILYLDKGKIIAEGTHNKLMKNCPKYKRLYESEIIEDDIE